MTKRGALILLLWLTACSALSARQPLDCEQIVDEPLRSVPFTELTYDSFPNWVTKTYGVPRNEITQGSHTMGLSDSYTAAVLWRSDDKLYSGDFIDDALQRVQVDWDQASPTVGEVVTCLGTPSDYSAIYLESTAEVPTLRLHLWYRSAGMLVVAGTAGHSSEPPVIEDDIQVNRILITRPGPPEEMLRRGEAGISPDLRQLIEQAVQRWPGSWEELKIVKD